MPGLRKRGRVWYSDILIGGKRVRKPLSTDKRVAEEKLADMVKDRDSLRYGHVRKDIPWGTFKEKYLSYSRGSKAYWTRIRDESSLRSLEAFFLPRQLSDITPEVLERWKGHRRGLGNGAASINRELSAVKAMMRKAVLWGYLNSWDGSQVARLKMTRGRLLFYTPEQVNALLAECRMSDRTYDFETIALLGARAGLRPSEILHLAWEDLDLERGVLSITPKEGWQPKDKEQRHIPMAADLLAHLNRIPRNAKWVIGARPSTTVLSAFFRKIVRRAGLAGSLYTLRHTFASHLAQAGVSLYVIGELLGHSNPAQSQVYAHLQPSTLSDAIKRLPSL